MSNASYIAGYKFEREVIRLAEENGWKCFRSAGSHSLVDIILMRTPTTRPRPSNTILPPYQNEMEPLPVVVACQLKYHSDSQPKPSKEYIDLDIEVEKWWITRRKRGPILIQKVEKPVEVILSSVPFVSEQKPTS